MDAASELRQLLASKSPLRSGWEPAFGDRGSPSRRVILEAVDETAMAVQRITSAVARAEADAERAMPSMATFSSPQAASEVRELRRRGR